MPTGDQDFRGVSLKRELVEQVEKYVESHPEYKSKADFIHEATRLRLEQLKKPLHFKMLNHDDRGVKVWDYQWENGKGFDAQIQFTPEGKAYCCLCDAFKCEHIRFALEQKDVRQQFKEKGWKLPDV